MAKTKSVFFCTNCGNETPKWMGRCPSCGKVIFFGVLAVKSCPRCHRNLVTGKKMKKQ